ncbi:pantoate--beta-alanine ligase [Methylomarinum sp. Ch1-1]|uniref:Pantothenate synthetase n=1 Tax=Methylomarinum roseum TaxID=3067653 RepID=A0AAU7NXZ4_9GAMM|nr:pantoate--beta-alanine ligase [Methylomarinum sp. Ch1-1]MDP4522076.1 pantoate--beta-alanine ligase [Methylomarinum sp. Ch1-1]
MHTVTRIAELRATLKQWRRQGLAVALVPTMGNLHAGHIALVNAARQRADKVVVSIFVNPTQFGAGEDYAAYPRTEQQDSDKLNRAQADLLFLPAVAEIYPEDAQVSVTVGGLADDYCGGSRPGHFNGVATVVCKLFNMVQPDLAFFGEKDFQQLAIIRRMVVDLNFPVQICAVPIVREPDGLAMSSRNGYLTAEERAIAPKLYQSLCRVRDAILAGQTDFHALTEQQMECLRVAGFLPDYLAVSRIEDLRQASEDDRNLVILAAAKLGRTRLIDNLCFSR